MADNRRKLAAGLAALVAFSLVVCPLGWGAGVPASAAGQGEIGGTWIIPTIIGTPIVLPTPIPTLGPGQYFEEDDPDRPSTRGGQGDDDFGWADLAANPDMVLVWYTDEEGTHYLVVSRSSDLFLGTLDSATGTRLEDGFEDYIRQREELEREMLEAGAEGIGSSAAGIIALACISACPETGGAGCLAGIIVLVATGGGNGIRNMIRLIGMNFEIAEVEDNIGALFAEARQVGGT